MASSASTPKMTAREEAQALLAKLAVLQAQAEQEEREQQERLEREEREHAEREERKKIEAARVAAEKEETWKARRAAKRAEKRKAAEEVVGEEEVEVVDGPGEETRPKKRSKTVESNAGPDGEAEMEAAETACKR